MNLNQRSITPTQPSPTTAADQFITELSDPNSTWHQLKISEMPSGDYLFVPESIWERLIKVSSVQNFLCRVQALLGSCKTGITVISFHTDGAEGGIQLYKHDIRWSNGRIAGLSQKNLSGTQQYHYVKTLLDHSEPLISAPST